MIEDKIMWSSQDPEDVKTVAIEFVKCLKQDLTHAQIEEVKKRNTQYRAEGLKNVCASHDFCDANMVMDRAFKNLGIPIWIDVDDKGEPTNDALDAGMDPEMTELWNAAWVYADDNFLMGDKP